MIQRINLIEKQALAFTYERLVQICLVILAFNVLMVGWQFLKVARLKPQIATFTTQVEALTQEQAELTKQPTQKQQAPQKKKVSIGQYQQLFDILESSPMWSAILRGMVGNLPNSVWITSLKSTSSMPAPPPKKPGEENDPKKQPPVDMTMHVKLEIGGTGTEVRAIAEFTSKLEKSPFFSNVTMINTIKDANGYAFIIQGDVAPTAEYAR